MHEPHPDYTTKNSPWPVAATVERLTGLIAERGMTIFATIDQRTAARSAGLELRETILIIFGNPAAGTPVMDAQPLAALDLPLKLLIWDDDGHTRVTYLSPAVLAARYGLAESLAAPLAGIERLVDTALTDDTQRPATHAPTALTYRTVALDEGEIFYREAGDRSAPSLLLLHGFPSSSAQYDRLMARLRTSLHVIAPDLPGFGRSPAPAGTMTFDRLTDTIDRFTQAVGLQHFSLYVFDFGAPVGFRLAVRHPERIDSLVIQNGNAYEQGLGPRVQPLMAYWHDRAAHEDDVRHGALSLEGTRTQYVEGTPDPTAVNPDLWELDQRYLELPGRDRVMLDLLYDYQTNLAAYPEWHEYLRTYCPPALVAWGTGDKHFPPAGAHAYLDDLPDAELHLLDTGHFATATHSDEIADLITAFLARVSRSRDATAGSA
jgi:pimeloyl-ACP methyl ester carboxylesterase/uncharacterized protein (DUF302 family)